MKIVRDFLDEYKVFRRISLVVTLYLTYKATTWSFGFAENTLIQGDKALMIGAIMAPLSLLQGAVFKFYNDTRRAEDT